MDNSVILTTLIVGGSSALRVGLDSRITDKPAGWTKVALGTFVLGAILTVVSGAAPGVSVALSWLLCIAALMINGQAVLAATNRVLGK